MAHYNLLKLAHFVLLMVTLHSIELKTIIVYAGYAFDPTLQSFRSLKSSPLDNFATIDTLSAVQVNLGDPYYAENSRKNKRMTIIISSNESGFFENWASDLALEGFLCFPSYCQEDVSHLTEYRSYFLQGMANHLLLNTTLSIANGAWRLTTPPLYIKQQPKFLMGKINIDGGWIGLGTGAGANKNFQGENPIFSIIYDFPSKTGSLIFGFNSRLVDMSKPPQIVISNSNWQMQAVSMSLGDSVIYSNDSKPLPLAFDLMVIQASFPAMIGKDLFNQLAQIMNCDPSLCNAKSLTDFPPIIFTFSDGTQLNLGPENYLNEVQVIDQIFYSIINTASFRGNNYILLGRKILSHFYSVFQLINGVNTISLYSLASNRTDDQENSDSKTDSNEAESQISPNSSFINNRTFIITGLCIVFLLIFGVMRIKRKRSRNTKTYRRYPVNLELNEQQSQEATAETETLRKESIVIDR